MIVEYQDLGLVPYAECWSVQQKLFSERIGYSIEGTDDGTAGRILTVEHPPVFTLGKSAKRSNLLVSERMLREAGAELYQIDRGGDVTFHGPGQIVCYPIVDLSRLGIGLRRYVEILEQSVIDVIARYGIRGERIQGATGVWIENRSNPGIPRWNKICAIGVKASRYVTMHGLALNVSTELEWFRMINPCGFTDKGATSMKELLGTEVSLREVRERLVRSLAELLGAELKCI